MDNKRRFKITVHELIINAIQVQCGIDVYITLDTPQICCTNDGDELFREDIEGSVELWDVFVEWCKTAKHLDGRIGIAPF